MAVREENVACGVGTVKGHPTGRYFHYYYRTDFRGQAQASVVEFPVVRFPQMYGGILDGPQKVFVVGFRNTFEIRAAKHFDQLARPRSLSRLWGERKGSFATSSWCFSEV
jgi:hypothetical protein